ncbi:hypothetical protein F887_02498 [Acinetobacter sp. NIPH 2100]|nr:hypothetical protein F887_02498 [Acinetobacter sp. NIPH 2100]
MIYKKTLLLDIDKMNEKNQENDDGLFLRNEQVCVLTMCLWNTNISYIFLIFYLFILFLEKINDFYFVVSFSLIFSLVVIVLLFLLLIFVELAFSYR